MVGTEYRSRYGRIVFDDTGIEVVEPGQSALFVPWHAIGHIELEHKVGRTRLMRMHLADGRTEKLPAPIADLAAAGEIFRAWRGYSKTRVHEPHDEIPPEFRAATARMLDPVQDRVPEDRTILSRLVRRPRRRGRQTGESV
jgi:hypothetical protein